MPIRFTTEGQILFNAGQIVIRDDEDPSCCCGEKPGTDYLHGLREQPLLLPSG